MIVIGVLVLLFIAFLVVIWKAAKDWRWFNIVAAIFTMLLAILFLFPTAGALKSRKEWHKIKETLEVRAEKAVAETKVLKYGDAADPASAPGALILARELSKLEVEAGRRWRPLRLANNNLQALQLNRAAPAPPPGVAADPAAAAPAPAAGPMIPVGSVVYGFQENNVQGVEGTLPTFFLGEFRVTASTANNVTVTPTGTLENAQQQRITSGQAPTWALYELLPLDAHEPFVAEGSVSNDDNFLGRVDDALVNGLLGNNIRQETLQKYLRDGSRATADDPPISRWVKLEFTKNYSIDVDSPEQRGALDGGFFDGNGRAVDSRLQAGEDGTVKFKVGDRILIKEEAAKQLTDIDNAARLIDRYYLRPLNDYRFVLRRIRLRLNELANRTKELNYEREVLEAAVAATVAMLTTNQKEKLKLEQDLAQTQAEASAIRAYHDDLQKEITATRQRLVALYNENQAREREIRKAHAAVLNAGE